VEQIVDFCNVQFHQISKDKVRCEGAKPSDACHPEKLLQLSPTEGGWKGWGEISYGGHQCLKRAQAAEYLVRSWMGETYADIDEKIVSYIMGYDSLKAIGSDKDSYSSKQVIDARLRMDVASLSLKSMLFSLLKNLLHNIQLVQLVVVASGIDK